MVQIKEMTEDKTSETVNLEIHEPGFDFSSAKEMAKEKAFERCDYPMILSWKNAKTRETYPDYECGVEEEPFWIRYAKGRGANLTVDFNDGEYVFMILKM